MPHTANASARAPRIPHIVDLWESLGPSLTRQSSPARTSALSAYSYTTKNIGDDVQTLAAMEHVGSPAYFVDRERPQLFKHRPPSFLVANGWYMHRIQNFVPPPNITPFYVSFHVNDPAMLDAAAVAFLRKHAPIGCRDENTYELLTAKGVPAYLSGCLTLTLSRPDSPRDGGVVIVDLHPDFEAGLPKSLKDRAVRVTHEWPLPSGLAPAAPSWRETLKEQLRQTRFFHSPLGVTLRGWKKSLRERREVAVFDERAVLRLERARELLDLYARAELVITSRLHCAMPCIAFETPVLMFHKNLRDPRFGGIDELLRIKGTTEGMSEADWRPDVPPLRDRWRAALAGIVGLAVKHGKNPLQGVSLG
jgi:hypothetical protein